jgi:hypothetical protein
VDDQADQDQHAALADIFLGRRGGPHILKLPWVRKPSEVVDIRRARVELAATGRSLRVGDVGAIDVSRRADEGRAVACGIPGYERVGIEYYADELRVDDEPFRWELSGNCAFATEFSYSSS